MKRMMLFMVLLMLVLSGPGEAQDSPGALRKAADQGNAAAQTRLGVLYETGQEVSQDEQEAVRWYRKAAEQGYADAQYNLGVNYTSGQGVARDDREAVRWFWLAAEQGHMYGQHNLGVMYGKGQGITQDLVQSYVWLTFSALQGNTQASQYRDRIAGIMTPAQRAQAQEMANNGRSASGQTSASVAQNGQSRQSTERALSDPQTVVPAEIEQTVRAWAQAWTSRNLPEYLGFYSETAFVPEKYANRDEWKTHRQTALQSKTVIRVRLTDLKITVLDENHAQCFFVQNYWSKHYQEKGKKNLSLQREKGAWKIVREYD